MPVSQVVAPSAAREVSGFALLLALLMLFAAGKAVFYDTLDPDCFWHLRVAGQIQTDGIRPLVDQISFASIKSPWTPYSWLAELGMKWIWDHFGIRGAVAVQAILQATFVLLVAMCCIESSAAPAPRQLLPITVSTALATFLSLPYLSFRPVLFAIVLIGMSTLLLLRDRRLNERSRAIWTLPALAAISINVHIFAVFIPIFVAALLVGAWIERDRPKLKRYAILFTACVLGCCCTPMLGGTICAILDYSTTNPLARTSMIAELEPMYRGTLHQLTLLIVLAIVARTAAKRTVRAGEMLWLGSMLILWIKCGRAAPIFVPVFAPVMCGALPQLSDRALSSVWMHRAVATVLLIGIIRLGVSMPQNGAPEAWLNRRGPDLPGYPVAAADFVQTKLQPRSAHLINEFDWGGYLAWKLPEYQVLLDGRTQLYTPDFWQRTYLTDRRETTKILASIEADAAILPIANSRFCESLTKLGWKQIYKDDRAEVLIPPATVAGTTE
jgi:hypothetical protein